MSKDLHNRIYDLLARKMAGIAGSDELLELDKLLAAHPGFQFLHDQLLQFPEWDENADKDITDQAYAAQFVKMMYADKDRLPASPGKTANRRGKKVLYLSIGLVAAAALFIMIIVPAFLSRKTVPPVTKTALAKNTMERANVKSKLTLPDGTIVYLNTNSHLEYAADFDKTSRNVTLTGEAFFDVVHNPAKPFIVHTSKATIKVLGTKFNVKSYNNELWEATLLQGKIEMHLNNRPQQKLQLEPSQKVSIITGNNESRPVKPADYKIAVAKIKTLDSTVAETAWMSNKLVFIDKSLGEIAKDLERVFGITVTFQSAKVMQYRYTGIFENDDLEKILRILDLSKHIKYHLQDNSLVIE